MDQSEEPLRIFDKCFAIKIYTCLIVCGWFKYCLLTLLCTRFRWRDGWHPVTSDRRVSGSSDHSTDCDDLRADPAAVFRYPTRPPPSPRGWQGHAADPGQAVQQRTPGWTGPWCHSCKVRWVTSHSCVFVLISRYGVWVIQGWSWLVFNCLGKKNWNY